MALTLLQLAQTLRTRFARQEGLLAELALSKDEEILCRHFAQVGIRSILNIDLSARAAWGGLTLLVAARIFRQCSAGPFVYARIFSDLELPDTTGFLLPHYSALERGARDVWGFRIPVREGGHRQFQWAMLHHSGAAWPAVLELVGLVERFWRWETLPDQPPERLLGWITQLVAREYVSGKCQQVLKDEDTRRAVAERLVALAELRGELNPSRPPSELEDVQRRAGAPSRDAAEALLERFFPARRDSSSPSKSAARAASPFSWCLEDEPNGGTALKLVLPESLSAPELLATGAWLELQVQGAPRPTRYEREGGSYRRVQGPERIRIRPGMQAPVTLLLRWQDNSRLLERTFEELSLPDEGLLCFTSQGRPVRGAVPAGQTIRLLLLPPYTSLSAPGFGLLPRSTSTPGSGFPMYEGVARAEPISVRLEAPGEAPVERVLSLSTSRLQLHLEGPEVPGLRLNSRRVFARWPKICVETPWPSLDLQVEGPGLPPRTSRKVPVVDGELILPGELRRTLHSCLEKADRPVRFTLRVQAGVQAGDDEGKTLLLVLAPTLQPEVQLSAARSRLRLAGASLSHPDGVLEDEWLVLPSSLRGPQRLTLYYPAASYPADPAQPLVRFEGTWEVDLHPPSVQRVLTSDRSPTALKDLPTLVKKGGLLFQGPPRGRAGLFLDSRAYELTLDALGQRLFALSELNPALLQDRDHLKLEAWVEGADKRSKFYLVAEREQRPVLQKRLEGDLLHLTVTPKARLGLEAHLELVREAAPWEPPLRLPLTRVSSPVQIPVQSLTSAEALELENATVPVLPAAPPPLEEGPDLRSRVFTVSMPSPTERLWGFLMEGDTRMSGRFTVGPAPAEAEPSHPEPLWVPALQQALTLHEESTLHALVEMLERYGLRGVPIRSAVRQLLGKVRLRALLRRTRTALDKRLLSHLAPPACSWLWVREGEVADATRELLEAGVLDPARGLKRMSELRVGLLQPYWQSTASALTPEEIQDAAARLSPYQSWRLTELELDHIRTPDNPELAPMHSTGARVQGLLQGRRLGDQALGELLGRLPPVPKECQHALEQLRRQGMLSAQEKTLPSRLREVEERIQAATLSLHFWRVESPSRLPDCWALLEALHDEVPRLLDFWASHWAGLWGEARGRAALSQI